MSDKINAVKTMTIRLDPLTSKHLDELVKRQHRTRTKIIRQLISAAALGLVTKAVTKVSDTRVSEILTNLENNIIDDVYPDGWAMKCTNCGITIATLSKEQCKHYLFHGGWPRCSCRDNPEVVR